MTVAVCIWCGGFKNGPLALCQSCSRRPRSEADATLSLVLSDDLAPKSLLAKFANEIRRNEKLSVPSNLLDQARAVLSDPIFRAKVGMPGLPDTLIMDEKQYTSAVHNESPLLTSTAEGTLSEATTVHTFDTVLHKNAFARLGVSIRDNRHRIVEQAEEKSLELDNETCQKARSELTNPRTRLSAEIGWLPGVSPRKASQLIDVLRHKPMAVRQESGLPTLAHLNLLSAAFETVDEDHHAEDLSDFIQEVAYLADELDPEDVLRDINEDRAVSGFPEVRAVDLIEAELTERKRYYRSAIKDAIDRLSPSTLIQVMTKTVNEVTAGGDKHAPELIDELVDSYEVEAQDFLQKEAENVHKLINAARDSAGAGETAVKTYVDKLDAVARNWDRVAQPIQLSAKARGIDHEASRDLAFAIRSLAIDLFNKHDLLTQAQRLTVVLKELFAEIPDVAERVEQDADALDDISQRQRDATAIGPIRALLESVLKNIEQTPISANNEGRRLLIDGPELLRTAPIAATSPAYLEAKDMLAIGLLRCAVAYGNETSKWGPCIALLERALEFASDAALRKKVSENLAIVNENHASLGDLEPVDKAPSLSTINGIGMTLYGNTDSRPDGSHLATYYFVILAIPVFPIARYRVISTGAGYRFLGKGRLRTFDKWHIAISLSLIVLMIING